MRTRLVAGAMLAASCLSDPVVSQDMCGGLLGETCSAGEYCNFTPEAQCGAADQTGTCEPKPEVCVEQYDPVCGCDGQTYSSVCYAAMAGISVARSGECGASEDAMKKPERSEKSQDT